MERGHGYDHQALEQQAQAALAARETSIEKANARDDQPDQEGADDEVDIVELEAGILSVYIDCQWIAASWLRGVELRLYV